jgi:hypothetical protein
MAELPACHGQLIRQTLLRKQHFLHYTRACQVLLHGADGYSAA